MKKFFSQLKWLFKFTRPVLGLITLEVGCSSLLSFICVSSALISKSLIDAASNRVLSDIFKWLGILGAVFLLRLFLSYLISITDTYSSTRLTNTIQKHIYTHITYSKWLPQSKYHSMDLLSRINNDTGTVSSLITGCLSTLVSLAITFISSFITLIILEPVIAITAVIIAPVFMLISILFGKKVKKIYIETQEHSINYNRFLQESIQNLMIVKTFCKEKSNLKKLDELQDKTMKLNLRSNTLGILASLMLTSGSYLTYFIVFCIGAVKLSDGLITFGTLTALLQLFNNIQKPLSGFASIIPGVIRAFAAIERLKELEELPLEISEPSDHTDSENKTSPALFSSSLLSLKHVQFEYVPKSPVLKDVSLDIRPGEIIGLIGPSGSGKTTLIRLLLSLLQPDLGSITLHTSKKDVSLNCTHRHLISYVPQGNTLFSGSILDNLRYGNPDASSSQIQEALKASCSDAFISQLDDGLHTLIGEQGTGLSGGQAQRLTIARAFLKKTPFLILDEATSSLDAATENHILHAIQHLSYHPACIIITHRSSALSICNRIFEIKDQQLTEKLI